MEWLKTAIPFLSGALVGGGAAYLALPPAGEASSVASSMPPGAGGPGGLNGAPGGMNEAGGAGGPGIPAVPAPGGAAPMPSPPVGAPPPELPPALPLPANPILPPPADPDGSARDAMPAAPANAPQTPGGRLEKHLRNAPTIWSNLLHDARAHPRGRELVPDIEAHIAALPTVGEKMPPMQEVAAYLATSKLLLERMRVSGMDVSMVSVQIDTMLRPPRGKIPGGPKGSGDSPR